jgi:hypothetical protein
VLALFLGLVGLFHFGLLSTGILGVGVWPEAARNSYLNENGTNRVLNARLPEEAGATQNPMPIKNSAWFTLDGKAVTADTTVASWPQREYRSSGIMRIFQI